MPHRNSVARNFYLYAPFQYVVKHYSENRAQRRSQGHYDRAKRRFIFAAGLNMTYRKD